jgi:hypothetical protein
MRATVYYGTPYTFIFKIFVNITIKGTLQRVHMIALCALGGKLHEILISGYSLNHTYCTTILNVTFFC